MEITDFIRRKDSYIRFTAKLNRSEWLVYMEIASLNLQKDSPIPGFRAGKAPIVSAESFYGESLYKNAANIAGSEIVHIACQERGLEPVSVPALTMITADRSGYICTVEFYNYPELTQLVYKGLIVEKPHMTATESMVEQVTERYMDNHLNVHRVSRPARMGDIVEVDFNGTRGGDRFPFDHGKGIRFLMGSGKLFAGLDEALVGSEDGAEMMLTLTMPGDFHRQEIAGNTLELNVRLLGVWARERYEINDEFVRREVRGASTVEEFRKRMRADAQAELDHWSEQIYQQNLEQALADAIKDPVPEAMVATALERFVNGLRKTAASMGKTAEEVLAEEGRTLEDYKAMALPHARRQVYCSIALDYIRTAEGFSVTTEEVEKYYQDYAIRFDMSSEDARNSAGDAQSVADIILSDRAMDIVSSHAIPVVVEKPVPESFCGEDRDGQSYPVD